LPQRDSASWPPSPLAKGKFDAFEDKFIRTTKSALPGTVTIGASMARGLGLSIGIRPEYVEFTNSPGRNVLSATVVDILDFGSVRVVDLIVAGRKVKAKLQRERAVPSGDVLIRLPADKIRLYVDDHLVTTGRG